MKYEVKYRMRRTVKIELDLDDNVAKAAKEAQSLCETVHGYIKGSMKIKKVMK